MTRHDLPFDLGIIIPEDDSVRLLNQFVVELDLEDLYQTYSPISEDLARPRQLLKIVLYGYINKIYSARDAERRLIHG